MASIHALNASLTNSPQNHFNVPIRAFDQAAHQAHLVLPRQGDQVHHQVSCTGLIALHRQAQAAPLRTMRCHVFEQRLKHIERQFQPVDLFSVDRETDVGPGRLLAQAPNARHQLSLHALDLCVLEACMERAELDRNAVIAFTRHVQLERAAMASIASWYRARCVLASASVRAPSPSMS